jgi:hypothetical protein
MSIKRDVWEIFELVEKTKSRKDKIEILRQHNIMPVRDVLQGTFDPNIQWNLPGGTPPYTPNAEDAPTPSTLRKQHMKFKYFVKGLRESDNLNKIKRERMFIDMLESVPPREAEILVSMINKQQPVKGLTEKLVKEAYPDLIP